MRIYKIAPSLDLKEVGDYPQIQDFKSEFDSRHPESCSRTGRYNSEVDIRASKLFSSPIISAKF